ncbi:MULTISPECIES: HAMP domain-containing methyl-accepting chemotaxis protein [unclassified Bradyrhizobium]|uniref:methyl-accepting chemotaxis protein n=1 Tax=unclassified Bradyrhizobium TaxID=2631580 RepID=UPI002478DB27|nr:MULTISPECIES: HAMP domain-containing methyl-accepting chemotaxis protein [unclassified Bradyrhizobium]WGR69479.1 methyl-accepting chemotaxis protein [Bradyrhizobium sp. ISRA426]WGR81534.1 methyl-accepting chemotaxis protein [Bradyrhizobium sp. ISRA430]WGR84718.1 methyl-accepting chemotaxis protein [Bradyrhizobium sp. ISRA432]
MLNFRLGIRGRLYAGFAALAVVGLTMAVVAVWNLRAVQDQVARQSALSDSTARVLEISTHLQAIQRANLRYIYDANEPAMREAAEREAAAIELLQVGAKGTLSEERRKLYNGLIDDIAKMRSLRDNLGDAVNEARTGKASLLPSGDELTVKMGKLVDAARASADEDTAALVADLESRILLVQIANWRFLALRDTKGPANFRTNADRAAQRLAAIEKGSPPAELRAALAPVKTSLGIYKSAFETTSAAMLQADEIYHNNLAPLIVESIGKLKLAETTLKTDYRDSRANAEAVIAGTTSVQEIAGGLAILFGAIVAFLIARSIVGPLTSMTRAMGLLAGGDLEVEVPGRGKADEIGDMAKAIQVFKDSMVETERLRREQAEFEARQAEQRKADMVKLAGQFERAVGEIVDTVSSASGELEASAGTLTATASRAQDLSTEVAAASQEASANVQAVASATEELSSSVSEIARQVQESARIAGEAVSQAIRTNERVGELSKAAARIGDVVELISTIAGQTNLLALNATIEAARAGEAGRGFAVVASEVKALAEQTAKATGEIAQQVSGIQTATEESVGSIREISDTIERLSEISSAVAAAVEEQGAATQEISRNVQQAAHGTQRVSTNIGDVQRGASETGSASSQVLSAARSLSADSSRLKLEVSKFLNSVHAA